MVRNPGGIHLNVATLTTLISKHNINVKFNTFLGRIIKSKNCQNTTGIKSNQTKKDYLYQKILTFPSTLFFI